MASTLSSSSSSHCSPLPTLSLIPLTEPRFAPISTVKSVDAYPSGGHHPVSIGECLHKGQYQIIRKQGSGSFSSVWLARDLSYVRGFLPSLHKPDLRPELCSPVASLTFLPLATFYNRNSRNVAVKIKKDPYSIYDSELSILNHLCQRTGFRDGAAHVISILNWFILEIPSGRHLCLVFEALGPSVSAMLEYTPQFWGGTPRGFVSNRFPLWLSKRILRHILLGISYLHSNLVIHGDIHCGNILFVTPNLDLDGLASMDNLAADEAEGNFSVTRLDGKIDMSAPRYISTAASPLSKANRGSDLVVQISDLGSACTFHDRSRHPVMPVALRAPEVVLKAPFDQSIDIWSFGCLLYEFVIGRSLFDPPPLHLSPESQNQIDDAHLLEMIELLGPLPSQLLSKWPRSHKYMHPDGEIFNEIVDGSMEQLFPTESIETVFVLDKPTEVDDEEGYVILNLLRYILNYDPAKRPSAVEILDHPWFKDSVT